MQFLPPCELLEQTQRRLNSDFEARFLALVGKCFGSNEKKQHLISAPVKMRPAAFIAAFSKSSIIDDGAAWVQVI